MAESKDFSFVNILKLYPVDDPTKTSQHGEVTEETVRNTDRRGTPEMKGLFCFTNLLLRESRVMRKWNWCSCLTACVHEGTMRSHVLRAGPNHRKASMAHLRVGLCKQFCVLPQHQCPAEKPWDQGQLRPSEPRKPSIRGEP